MKSKINSRSKGANGERELAGVLSSFGFAARRGQQRSGVDSADVIDGPPGWHFEVKRVERLNPWKAFAQAQRDAPNGETPLVAARRNHGPWLAIVDLRVLLGLICAEGLLRERHPTAAAATKPSPAVPRVASATGSPIDDRTPARRRTGPKAIVRPGDVYGRGPGAQAPPTRAMEHAEQTRQELLAAQRKRRVRSAAAQAALDELLK